MKTLSIEKMESIQGGDCFGEADAFFAAWDAYLAFPGSTFAAGRFYATWGDLINCVAII